MIHPATSRSGINTFQLTGLERSVFIFACVVVAVIQAVALWRPGQFVGLWSLDGAAFPLLLVWFAFTWGAMFVSIPLAIMCLLARWSWPIGAVLIGISATNIVIKVKADSVREEKSAHSEREVQEYDREIARCKDANIARFKTLRAYFDTPQTVVALGDPWQIAFGNGVKVNIPRDPGASAAPERFARLYHERLAHAKVRVVLTEPSGAGGCPSAEDRFGFAGAVFLDDKAVTSAADPDDFPYPRESPQAVRPSAPVTRWHDARSGARMYTSHAGAAVPGHAVEVRQFVVDEGPGPDSRTLYQCSYQLKPPGIEHFLTIKPDCEGFDRVSVIGHISASRTGRTPRALLRCYGTVAGLERTANRDLVTLDMRECAGGLKFGFTLGYVADIPR